MKRVNYYAPLAGNACNYFQDSFKKQEEIPEK